MKRALVTVDRYPLRCFAPETSLEFQHGLEALNGRGLLEDEGMVFVYPVPRVASIHMAGVLFPIDVLFVLGNTVEAIAEWGRPGSMSRWAARASFVLEVRGGWAHAHGITVGSDAYLGLPGEE